MSNVKKLMMTAAGAGGGLNVEEVFSTDVWNGNSSTQDITNGIDLSNEGYMLWIKKRSSSTFSDPVIYDSERTYATYTLSPNSTASETSQLGVYAFNTDGYGLSNDSGGGQRVNTSGYTYAGWTFRKAPKFFDVVTFAGTGSNQTISHNLGSTPGMIVVKDYSGNGGWIVYHRSNGATKFMYLNGTTTVQTSSLAWNDTAPSATEFTVGTLGGVNVSGRNYVAYIFAHNDGDGEFGPTGDQDIIKCGSYTGNNSQELNIGFEPQWIMIKRTDVAASWIIYDNIRGMADRNSSHLYANASAAEVTNTLGSVMPTAQGIQFDANTISEINSGGDDFIYVAIRRGPMAVPESATDVFAIDTYGGTLPNPPTYNSGFEVDMALARDINSNDNWELCTRQLKGSGLRPNYTNAQDTGIGAARFDYHDGWRNSTGTSSDYYSWMWKRAPNYFDVVAYNGNGNTGRNINHNLGVVPEMMWIKCRSNTDNWIVYHKDIDVHGDNAPETDLIYLNLSNAASDAGINTFQNTAPTDSVFTVGQASHINGSGRTYIAYLFASLNGISKVGSYTGTGSTLNIDCGFSSGARFVITKRTDAGSDWQVFDTERGIVAGNDSLFYLNEINSVNTTNDIIDPYSSGFSLTSNPFNNISGGSYIFYAIA